MASKLGMCDFQTAVFSFHARHGPYVVMSNNHQTAERTSVKPSDWGDRVVMSRDRMTTDMLYQVRYDRHVLTSHSLTHYSLTHSLTTHSLTHSLVYCSVWWKPLTRVQIHVLSCSTVVKSLQAFHLLDAQVCRRHYFQILDYIIWAQCHMLIEGHKVSYALQKS